ncbi:ferredoxin [Thermocatellispora tengchongensis]|uniref:Ferredoxin n=1 Tax=Thermocatellispora tengchongensis TaxID=1073253 RepID=A0A840P843_9ACTN|nr:ferredoxin [Thermocatellispora tengchongensis]MBB5135462.1 ferredoxin [Thermocatellispora tengchongensis]
MRVRVEVERCIGAGQCVLSAPGVFDQDDDGVVTLLRPEPPAGEAGAVREALLLCPSGALRLEQD